MENELNLIEDPPTKNELPEDLIKKVASKKKPWTTKKVTPSALAIKLKNNRKKRKMTEAQLENLRQFSSKPHSEESKKNSLNNLRVQVTERENEEKKQEDELQTENIVEETIEESTIEDSVVETIQTTNEIEFPEHVDSETLKEVLGIREQKYFVNRWKQYIEEFGEDFNTASDYDDLKELILLYIQQIRLEKKKKSTPSMNCNDKFNQVCNNVHIRIQNLKTALKARRRDRLESNERKQSSFMNLIMEMAKNNDKIKHVVENKVVEQIEIESYIEKKKNRDVKILND